MIVNFQPLKVCLQHSKAHQMYSTTHLQHAYKVIFNIKTMSYVCLFGRFTANVRDQDHEITKIHHSISIGVLRLTTENCNI